VLGASIRVETALAEGDCSVYADRRLLERTLLNLVVNAREAMPDGGTLRIASSNESFDASQASIRDLEAGQYVRVTISDSGTGMPPEVQARAFDPFYTTKPIGKGTGLGLSMIYGFVRQSQGSIRIDSQVGKGTTIEICLPRFHGSLEPAVRNEGAVGAGHAGSNEVVLVVEDEDIVRLLVAEVLKDLGYRALEASDGGAGLRIVQSPQRIDLLITDIGLPGVNGRQLAADDFGGAECSAVGDKSRSAGATRRPCRTWPTGHHRARCRTRSPDPAAATAPAACRPGGRPHRGSRWCGPWSGRDR